LAGSGKTADLVLACFGQFRKNSRFGTGLFWPVQEKQQIWYWPVLASLGVKGLKSNNIITTLPLVVWQSLVVLVYSLAQVSKPLGNPLVLLVVC